jgi:hypothetical protein
MKRKVLSWLCITALALSMTACAGGADVPAAEVTESVPAPAPAPEPEPEPAPAEPEVTEVSVDFEDGNYAFALPYLVPADAGNVEVSVADFGGSKALAAKLVDGKALYVGIDVSSLLGDKVADVKTIEMTMGTSFDDGSFNATSGQITAWSGADLVQTSDTWSVFVENKNPKVAVATLDAGEEFVAGANNIIVVNLNDNAGVDAHGNPTLYLDNLRFLDGSGNLLTADTAVAFAAPKGYENTSKDMTHLAYLKNAVELEGFAVSGAEWSQAGVDLTPEVQELLVPGSIVEIEYSSESGDIWLVVTNAVNGWTRINNEGRSLKNTTKNVAQIPYEDIIAACGGDDASALVGQLQCESDKPWEVYSVKIGTDSGIKPLKNPTEVEGFAVSADGWAQAGVDLTPELQALLVPGAVVEVEYTSESGNIWLVVTNAVNGWTRINDGGKATSNGKVAQFTYEDIMAACGGDDATALTGQLQCESELPWEVYSVKVGVPADIVPLTNVVDLPGFAVKVDAEWSQAGIDITPEIQALLVPGSVVEVEYTSESGNIWLVVTNAVNGWTRINDGGRATITGKVAQFTYEDIMAACGGDDATALTGQLQGESEKPWEIYRVGIGTAKVAE